MLFLHRTGHIVDAVLDLQPPCPHGELMINNLEIKGNIDLGQTEVVIILRCAQFISRNSNLVEGRIRCHSEHLRTYESINALILWRCMERNDLNCTNHNSSPCQQLLP